MAKTKIKVANGKDVMAEVKMKVEKLKVEGKGKVPMEKAVKVMRIEHTDERKAVLP